MNNTLTPAKGFIDFDENGKIILVSTMPTSINIKTFDNNDFINLNNNRKQNDNDGSIQYECKQCHKKFSKKSYWKRHELSHEKNNLFECNVCNKTFMHNTHLTQHMKLHKEKEHQCDICGVKIRFKFNLDKHRKIHIPYKDKNGNINYLTVK